MRENSPHQERALASTAKAQQEALRPRGRGWHGDSAGHAAAGRKGGKAVAKNREHMAEIGRIGGKRVSADRSHMAEIGRRGGSVTQERQRIADSNPDEQ